MTHEETINLIDFFIVIGLIIFGFIIFLLPLHTIIQLGLMGCVTYLFLNQRKED